MGKRTERFWRRIRTALRREEYDRELAEELEFHLAMKQREKEFAGLDAKPAFEAARRELGNLTRAKESSREAWMFQSVETLSKDVRYACRVLSSSPVFTACAVLTLALGIGANAAIFTLIDALLLRGLPVPQPDRMIQLAVRGEEQMVFLTYPLFQDVKERTHSFSGIFSWNSTDLWAGWGAQARPIIACAVSGGAYQTLELDPQAGRLFTPADDNAGAPLVAVISDRFWEREFHRDPRAIGRTLLLTQRPFTIIGVTRRDFLGVRAGESPDVTITVHANAALHPDWHTLESKNTWYILVLARLKPGVTEAQARAELAAISPAVMRDQVTSTEQGERNRFLVQKLDLIPGATGSSFLVKRYRKPLLLLMCVSGLVLLLACVNLASLSLSRVAPRRKKLSVRLALGSGRGRMIKQLLTGSVIVSLGGGALGAVVGFWATRGLLAFLSTQQSPLLLDLNPDWRSLSLLGTLAILTGLLCGAAPAIQGTDLRPNDALKQSSIGAETRGRRFSFGNALVVLQVALSVLLIAGAMLFVRTFEALKWQNTGFDRNNVVFLELNAEGAGLKDEQLAATYDALLQRIRGNAQVRSATLTNVIPVSGSYEWRDLLPKFWPNLKAKERVLYVHRVASDYFQTLGLRLLRGRDFLPNDSSSSTQPGILSASAARALFPKQDPIGQYFHQDDKTTYRIIGVADDANYASLREQSPMTVYLASKGPTACNLVLRGELDKSAAFQMLRGLVKETGKDIRLGTAVSLTEQIDQALVTERLIALLVSFFAALAAVLVSIGLYGVVGYSAARRTSEIGVRLALGATRENVLWLVMREAIWLSIIGILVGVPAALLGGRVAASLLYGVKFNDPATLLATVVLIVSITLLASFLPADRASRLDPMGALRYE